MRENGKFKVALGQSLRGIGILAGIIAIITMFISLFDSVDFISYGGDAYTGIQNAAAQAANNILDFSFWLFLFFGAAFLSVGTTLIRFGKAEMQEKGPQTEATATPCYYCPKCGASITQNTAVCEKCGQTFDWNNNQAQ